LPGLYGGSSDASALAVWVDASNDQRLDFLLAGQTSVTNGNDKGYADIWQGGGDGTFLSGGPPRMPTMAPAADWGDADGDGRLDLLILGPRLLEPGDPGPQYVSQFWRSGSGWFNQSPIPGLPIAGNPQPAVAWGDYDNDGRLDFIWGGAALEGDTNYVGNVSQIWHSEGNGDFSNVTETAVVGLPGVSAGASAAWGDYDNDGKLDFLLSGVTNGIFSLIWHNNGDGTFSDLSATLAPTMPEVIYGALAWGDYDNDGWRDILFSGQTVNGPRVQVWRNTGSGFTNINAGITRAGKAAWGDYDNDGRLDIVLTGHTGSAPATEIWRNTLTAGNNPPTTPTGLQAAVTGSVVTLSWNASTDDHTPSATLSYNLRIGTSPGAGDVMAPMALSSGQLTVPRMGNMQFDVSRGFRARFGATYYWSVQAVDGAYAGSPFAPEQSFTLTATVNRPGDIDGDGIVDQTELTTVVSNYWQTSPPAMESVVSPSNTVFQFGLTNLSSINVHVLASTNVAAPLMDWIDIGPATLRYQFTDPDATNHPQRFYQLIWP